MKRSSSPRLVHRTSGAALIIILAILVLVVGMCVAFLSLSMTERRSASVFLTTNKTRQMADNAVGIVQAQINAATTRGAQVAWASQPGMIRTYTTAGVLDTAYKLYSATTMTETNPAAIGVGDLPGSGGGWSDSPAIWTDLNASVDVEGTKIYPIIDSALLRPGATKPEGFAVNGAPTSGDQLAPMPVRWLYVLQDGQIVAPSGGSGNTATVAQATATNPITGRIAFWTDDDSCKVNVNTAGVGGFWDVPRYYTTEDRKFATSQPLNGEFQRYPGHPAMTNLRAVFTDPTLTDEVILKNFTPRYQWGTNSSGQGTIDTFTQSVALNSGQLASAPLYVDTDELVFKPEYGDRTENVFLNKDRVRQAGFFLTTDSKSPEVNLFNLPRVSCWPISTNASGRTAFDEVIAFASSLDGQPYYFQRTSALDPKIDANIARNTQIFSYLHYLTDQTIPGFGVKFSSKFGEDNDQILTEIWDYIRSINLLDTRLVDSGGTPFALGTNTWGGGYVSPLERGTDRGVGRAVTLSELAFVFICTADPKFPDSNATTNNTLQGTTLADDQRRIQMMIVPEAFSPSQGNFSMKLPPFFRIKIDGLGSLRLGTESLFPGGTLTFNTFNVRAGLGYDRRFLGGQFDFRALISGSAPTVNRETKDPGTPGYLDSPTGGESNNYPFISRFVTIPVPTPNGPTPGTMNFTSGELTVTLESSADGATWATQTFKIQPPSPAAIPIPNLVRTGTNNTSQTNVVTNKQYWWAFSNSAPTSGATAGRLKYLGKQSGSFTVNGTVAVDDKNSVGAGALIRGTENETGKYTDVVRSMVVSHGDTRIVAALKNVPKELFQPLGNWESSDPLMHTLSSGVQVGRHIAGGNHLRRHYVVNSVGPGSDQGAGGPDAPDFPSTASTELVDHLKKTGDFDNGMSIWTDGPFINKPDEGNVYFAAGNIPYYDKTEEIKQESKAFFSPNRLIPGPGMFGSLPTHVKRAAASSNPADVQFAWRTLLFRNQPKHPDAAELGPGGLPLPTPGNVPDHLLMDLFWMPTVEPYAISEPFSTAGKVNMNYAIEPFRYIERKTGLYAVLDREKIPLVPTTDNQVYKSSVSGGTKASYRKNLNVAETLTQFDQRFAGSTGRIFLSPSELCDLWLVPEGESVSSMESFWDSYRLTGDNMRERPYTTIIPRLTTKSNTYTVYFRVQTLKTSKDSPTTWDEAKGTIAGEYRGSTTIERFVDLNDPTLKATNFAANPAGSPTLDTFYRWRVLSNKQFAP